MLRKRMSVLSLIASQPQLITRLLAGHRATVNLQPAVINNHRFYIGTHTAYGVYPCCGAGCRVAVAYQQSALDGGFVTVDATLLGLPDGVAPQRYLFSSGK